MNFQFVHAADLHLGSPFLGLASHDEEIAKQFSNASRGAFTDLVTQAIDLKVAFVAIAGDVYDGDWKDTSIGLFFNREVARLDRAGIPVFLAKGNHDAESVVTKTVSLPASVKIFPSSKTKSFHIENLKIAIHGRSFSHRAVTENYSLSYPEPVPGWFNIGILHTSCGRPNHDNYAPCTTADLVRRNYQYWALGHIHEYEEICRDPWIIFPGNLQGRSVRECGPKGAVLVEVVDGEVKDVQRLVLDRARWAVANIDIAGIDYEPEVFHRIEEAIRPIVGQADGRLLALRVRICGASGLHRRLKANAANFSDEVQAGLHRMNEDAWLESVRVETSDLEISHSEDTALQSLDLAAMLDGVEQDASVRAAAASEFATITAKLPGGITSVDVLPLGGIDELLREARALVLGRATS